MDNEILKLIESRHCKRSFQNDKEVPTEILKAVISAAQSAPSSKNTQPWSLVVVKGEKLDELRSLLLKKYDEGEYPEKPQYLNRPSPLPKGWKNKMEETSKETYKLKSMNWQDKEDQKKHERANYTFFNAPVFFLILSPENAVGGTFLDVGSFMQNLLLGFASFEIGACPQFSMAKFSKTISEFCKIPKEKMIVCGMSIGYPTDDKINTLAPKREEFDNIVQWIE
eukprot:gene1443-12062_t